MKKISIVVPTYNVETYIHENIFSILNQTYKNIEVIYVDDGSDDNTKSIIRNQMLCDDRIILVEQKHAGVSEARNNGIQHATGEYLMFVDSDDKLKENAIEELININLDDYVPCAGFERFGAINSDNTELLCTIIEQYGKCTGFKVCMKNIMLFYEAGVLTSPCSKLFNLAVIKQNNLSFNKELFSGEDCVFVLNYFKFFSGVCITAQPIYMYRIHSNQSNHKRYRHYMKNYYTVYQTLQMWLNSVSDDENVILAFSERWLNFIERGSWEMDWKDELEKQEFISAVKWNLTGKAIDYLQTNKLKLRVDKKIFIKLVKKENFKRIEKYAKFMRTLRKIN